MPPIAASRAFSANGRRYEPPPRPVVVVCADGCADEYLDAALDRGLMPALQAMAARGWRGLARGCLPSFTNVNNAALITGVPPSEHGISGNWFLDPETGEERTMDDASWLRAENLLAAAARAGRRVAVGTAKDKLARILGHGVEGVAFSAERPDQARGVRDLEELVGRAAPPIYSADASIFVLDAGAALLERGAADLLYLSLTDYVQHKHAPEEVEALAFAAAMDRALARFVELGAVVALTADHGMNAKQLADGSPAVVHLETEFERAGLEARVVLPITDPYVRHHGALGSCAYVYVRDPARRPAVLEACLQLPGVTEAHPRERAARLLELPADRIGDVVVLADRHTTLGKRPEAHDLSAVSRGLRSHGGRYEEMVPLLVSEPLRPDHAARARRGLRSFDVFDLALNGVER